MRSGVIIGVAAISAVLHFIACAFIEIRRLRRIRKRGYYPGCLSA